MISGNTIFTSVFEFNDSYGQGHRVESNYSSRPPSHKINQEAEVLYLEAKPQEVKISSFWSFWLLPTGLGVMGLVFTLVGISLSIRTKAIY